MKKTHIFLLFILLSAHGANAQCDTVFSFAHLGLNPAGIAFDGTNLWCNSIAGQKFIYRFKLTGQLIDSIASPVQDSYTAGDMDFDGTHILLCSEQDGILYKLDPVTGAVVSQFNLPINVGSPSDPNNWGIAFDGTYLWHTEYTVVDSFYSVLYKLDATSGVVLNSFILAKGDLCIKFIHGSLYGLDPNNYTLHKIDTTNGNYLSSEPWCLGSSLGIALADNHVWVSQFDTDDGDQARVYQFEKKFLAATHSPDPLITCTLYPNPVSEQLHVQLSDIPNSRLRIEIGNLLDQHMQLLLDQEEPLPEQSFDFDLGGLPKGVYIVKIQAGTAQWLKTVIKV